MAKRPQSIEEIFPEWYDKESKAYEDLARYVSVALDSLLKDAKIEFVSVVFRLKEKGSCIDKIKKKDYKRPEDMTDVAALRVITYLQSDVERVSAILGKEFQVIEGHSVDKDLALGVDKVGYRSKHYVCSLSSARLKLKENARFKAMAFEVQVRTVLQHAWAEIEHDRNYKFGGKLPDDLKRRLNLVAGMLEIADLEFEEITAGIKKYQRRVSRRADKGDLDVEMNSISVVEFISKRGLYDDVHVARTAKDSLLPIKFFEEMESFGLRKLADLDAILNDKFLVAQRRHGLTSSTLGLLRRAMLYSDPEKYLSKTQVRGFHSITPSAFALLIEKVGEGRAKQLVQRAGLRSIPL